jgi:hypothetical protein
MEQLAPAVSLDELGSRRLGLLEALDGAAHDRVRADAGARGDEVPGAGGAPTRRNARN